MLFFRGVLRRIDYLAPSIGLYYRGSSKHYSKTSHVVSIISILLMALSIIYFIRPVILRNNPSTVVKEQLIKEAEPIDINPSSFFHLVHVLDKSNAFEDFDFNSFRVIGIEDDLLLYKLDKNISERDHWVYGLCEPDTDFSVIKDLDEYKEESTQFLFSKSVCIKKYFSKDNQQYYDINTNGFRWPRIEGGILNKDNNVEYTIIIEKCQQDTLELIMGKGSTCNSDSEIHNKIDEGLFAILYFVDYYIDLEDYDNSEKRYLTEISDDMQNEFYINNEITLAHLTVQTSKGFLFNRKKKKDIYDYDDSEKIISYKKDNNLSIYNTFTFNLSNIRKINSRRYKNLIDIFSNIGGFAKIIKVIAKLVIRYYNQYNILYDTKELITNLYNEDKKEKYKRKKIKLNLDTTTIENIDKNQSFQKLNSGEKNNNDKDNNNKINEYNSNNVNYNNINTINNNINYNNFNNTYFNNTNTINNNINGNINDNINDNNNINKNINIDKLIISRNNSQTNNELTTNKNNEQYSLQHLRVEENNLPNLNQENLDPKNEEKVDKNLDEQLNKNKENNEETSSYFVEKNKQFSYCSYVGHKLTCKRKFQFYKIYDKFRTNILSEEQLIRNHIVIYNLMKKEDISLDKQIHSLKEIVENKLNTDLKK